MTLQTIRTLQDAGVEPDVWKIEGLDRREDCERVVETARRDGRNDVGCIVLGRGADEKKVAGWLEIAASVPGFIGFAVGRTTFWDAMADYQAQKTSRQEAASRVAQRYREWVAIFERAHASHTRCAVMMDGKQEVPSGVRLVVADVDGTLVTPDKVLTPRTRAVVRTIIEAGIAFTITSGRPPQGTQDVDPGPSTPRPGHRVQRRVGRAAGPLDHSRAPGHQQGRAIGHRRVDEAQAGRLGVR